MQTNIIQTTLANNNYALIACFTGEYCPKTFNYYDSEDGPNFPDNPAWAKLKDPEAKEALDNLLDNEGWDCIIAIPKDQLQSYFDQVMQLVRKTFDFAFNNGGHLGDDTFYDYLPDAALMLEQIASYLPMDSEELLKPFMDLVAKYDATYPGEELLADLLEDIQDDATTILRELH